MKDAPADKTDKIVSENRKARFDYHLLETFEAGMVLLGTEVKSIREGGINLRESFCRLENGAPYLLGAHALWPSVALALAGLFGCGALVARVTARSWWFSGLRQLALGGAAAGVTYLLGSLFGASLG